MSNTTGRPGPATDIIESEEFIRFIDASLLELDYNDRHIRFVLIGGSFAFFAVLFISIIFLCQLFTPFSKLGLKFRVFLSLSIARGVFGFFSTVMGAHAIFKTTNLDRDVVFGTSATSYVVMLLTVGFFMFELSTVILSDVAFKSFSKMLLIHHGLALFGYSIAVVRNTNFCFGSKALLLEMSTPFSCLCYILLKAGMEHTMLWKCNQAILVHTFHLRSVLECHLWYIIFNNWAHIYTYMPTDLFFHLLIGLSMSTFIMTPYWGYKKTQQLFNPVDWNFQESRNTDHLANGTAVNGHENKIIKKVN